MAGSPMRGLISHGSRSKHNFLQIALPLPLPWLAHLCSLSLQKALCSPSLSSLLPGLAPSCENAKLACASLSARLSFAADSSASATTLACAFLLANFARGLQKALCSLSHSSLLPWMVPSCENATLQQRQQARERTAQVAARVSAR